MTALCFEGIKVKRREHSFEEIRATRRDRSFLLVQGNGMVLASCVEEAVATKLAHRLSRSACLWKYDQSSFFYNTACGHAFQFVDGDAKANGVTHCMYCGSMIEDVDEVDVYEC